jgi:hypothetical protein
MVERFKIIIDTFINDYTIDIEDKTVPKDPSEIIRKIFEQIANQGMKTDTVNAIVKKIETDPHFQAWNVDCMSTPKGEKLLFRYLKHPKKIPKVIEHYKYIQRTSITQWMEDMNCGKISMGLKSDDDFLKDYGYFERVPIDRFYRPFLFRTGIFCDYLEHYNVDTAKFIGDLSDPAVYKAYQAIIKDLCHDMLTEVTLNQHHLAEKPGIIDLYIWKHCASSNDAANICGYKPKCHVCNIQQYCQYGKKQR